MPSTEPISTHAAAAEPAFCFQRIDPDGDGTTACDRETQRILNLLNYTKTSGALYAATRWPAGYHAITLNGRRFAGQRDPRVRLQDVPFDFAGATVLDIGCNQGGMLFELQHRIDRGIGIDYDSRMVNAANAIRSSSGAANLDFYVFDLVKEDINVVRDFLPAPTVDIAFLLSMCQWLSNWREVVDFTREIAGVLLFESNGTGAQQREQLHYLRERYNEVELISDQSADDPKYPRQSYICR